MFQLNGMKDKADCVHQSSLFIETKLDYFKIVLPQEHIKECIMLAASEELKVIEHEEISFEEFLG